MKDKYKILNWDAPNRFLVVKNDEDGYLVDLDFEGLGFPMCGCRWFETKSLSDVDTAPPCKHVLMVKHLVASQSLFKTDQAEQSVKAA